MNNEDAEKLKEQFLKIWENNPVFRDNIAYLTQVHLRALPSQIILDTLECTEDLYYYELMETPPPPVCTY